MQLLISQHHKIMISTNNLPDIKFSDIRSLEGKKDKGFEELCVQLFYLLIGEIPAYIDRIEGRGGDGGVEAIAITSTKQHVGLQSKFFSKLDDSQWRQIDKSVRTAIEKHPELTRYIICTPLDRTPGQLEKWKKHLVGWATLKPALSIEWCGNSELLGHLAKVEVLHLLSYWFNCPEFSIEWVAKQTQVAIGHLHDRYTPQLHQTTSAENNLAFLTATKKASADHRLTCSKLVIVWRHVIEKTPREVAKLKSSTSLEMLQQAHQKMLASLMGGSLVAQSEKLIDALTNLSKQAKNLLEVLFPQDVESNWKLRREFSRNSELEEALDLTEELLRVVTRFVSAQCKQVWILTGEAGSGKSHLLANLARTILAEGRSCLLVVGERFASSDVLASQIPGLVGWDWTMRDLCACLSTQSAITGKSSVLMIDAINESPQRGLWRQELAQLVAIVQEYKGVKLLISCRSDCLDSTISRNILDEAERITHHGFDLQFYDAVKAYFDGYRVVSPQFPTLNPEFQNPLFLKTLCEAYRDRSLPAGPVSFVGVLTAWELRIAEEIEIRINCPQATTKRAVKEIIETLAKTETRRVNSETVESICLKHFPVPLASSSLYRHLNSAGLLQEVETQEKTQVRLQYERFSDVRIAQVALQSFSSKQEWLVHWMSNLLPSLVDDDQLVWAAPPQLFAYALLLPDAVGVELVECPIASLVHVEWRRSRAKESLWTAWLDALPWRVIHPSDTKIVRFFTLWANNERNQRNVWERMLQFSCISAHPLNADFLHRHLHKLTLPERELNWTIPFATENPSDQTGESIVAPFLYWADASAGKASNEQVRLAAIVLLWLTSSPTRELRDKATDIAIRILVANRSGAICMRLLEDFWEVNDPYVKERLLAAMCGVLPYLDLAASKQVAEFVFSRFWQQSVVAPHILQREYAAFIIRHACATGVIPSIHLGVLEKEIHAPKPTVWTEAQVQVYETDDAYGSIASSLKPEEMGHYGDFGRYVMGSAVHRFVDDEPTNLEAKGLHRGVQEHDARIARRYIWKRIIELGWTSERYAEFERNLGYQGRARDGKKSERISKKYQWIGLHEYLGLLSDSLPFREWNGANRPLRGAWELYARDYDPGAAVVVREDFADKKEANPSWWVAATPVVPLDSISEKQKWVASSFCSFEPYLTIEHEQRKWIVLHTHISFEEELGFGVEKYKSARMSQWIDVRVFLVPKSELSAKLEILRGNDFFGEGLDIPKAYQCWISEYPWHSALAEVDIDCRKNETWLRGLKQRFYFPVCEISNEEKHVLLPAPSLHRELGIVLGDPLSAPRLTSSGSMEIHSGDGRCIFRDSTQGEQVLLVDASAMRQYLATYKYALVWAVLSEKSAWDGSTHAGGLSRQSAVYVMDEQGNISGGPTCEKKEAPEQFMRK